MSNRCGTKGVYFKTYRVSGSVYQAFTLWIGFLRKR